MKGITVFETMTDIREDYIRDAELDACFLAAPVRKRERGPSAFSRFMNSGWGVAIICVLVAVSVMGGIIWAGFHAGDLPPGHNDAITGEVYLTAGRQTVTPEAFFGYSEEKRGNQYTISCGAGFYGEFTVSPVPTLTYASDLRLHMPKNYTLEAVYVYDPEVPIEEICTFETIDALKALTADTYYVALRITQTEGKNEYGYDYAFCLVVQPEVDIPIMERPHEWPVFDPPAKDFMGADQAVFPQIHHLTAAYTQVRMPEGMAWFVMVPILRGYSGLGEKLHISLYDPENGEKVAEDTQIGFLFPQANTILQLEDGRLITLHGGYVSNDDESLEVTANVWIWSKVDPDTGEELEEIQLCPMGETWSYTFDLTNSLEAERDWQYAFATYIYGLTDGEPPTLRVLLDNLFCATDAVKYDPVQYEHFSEEENLTTGWARLQRIMNGQLKPILWVWPETMDACLVTEAAGTHRYLILKPDGTLRFSVIEDENRIRVSKGEYRISQGRIKISWDPYNAYEPQIIEWLDIGGEAGVRIDDTIYDVEENKGQDFPAAYIPQILDILSAFSPTPAQYTVVDMDGDGTKEIVMQTENPQDASHNAHVFFVDPVAEIVVYHTQIWYNYLYEDGSFSYTISRQAPSYGVNKLTPADNGYKYKEKILWRVIDDGTDKVAYYIGISPATKEELDAYIKEIECEKVTWNDCIWNVVHGGENAVKTKPDGKG